MQECAPFLSAMGTLRSCEALSRLLDLGIELGSSEKIPVSFRGSSLKGVALLMFGILYSNHFSFESRHVARFIFFIFLFL